MPRCGRPARRAVSRPVCANEKNPALSVARKLLGTSKQASHPARPVPAVAPHGPRCSADACRSAIGRPILYHSIMWLLAHERERRQREDEALAARTRDLLRAALARHIPGTPVWVYGSLVAPGRFHEWSDVDVALEWLPSGMTLEYLQSLLSADVGREVDVCLINRTRLKPTIERSGERWTA